MRVLRFSMLSIGLLTLALTALGTGGDQTAPPAGATSPLPLLGLSVQQVVDRHGVPDFVQWGRPHLTFSYGAGKKPTVRFYDGSVLWVAPGFSGVAQPRSAPATGAYLGQPFHELLRRLGQPESVTASTHGRIPELQLGYGDRGGIDVSAGVVVGFRPVIGAR